MKKCLVSGSFDPITNGHIDIIKRALKLSDIVIVGVFNNEEKEYLFDLDTRVDLCKIALANNINIQVIGNNGMVCDFCKENNIDFIVRGFRNNKDYAYESEMSKFNYEYSGVITYLLPANNDLLDISSSKVKKYIDDLKYNDLEKYLPQAVFEEIRRIK